MSEPEPAARDRAVEQLIKGVRSGRPVVPLVGAGISIESGVPPLSEITRYLAKTKAYLRHRVFETRSPASGADGSQDTLKVSFAKLLQGKAELPPLGLQPPVFLREFGWPDPHEVTSILWHWLWGGPDRLRRFYEALDRLVKIEIVDSLGQIDKDLASALSRQDPGTQRFAGSYWKILLNHLTRSSPDLVDRLFQRLTHDREPATAHRYLAFLTPVLRLRLFLTINFDTLLEDSLRIEGFRPTVYQVADGLSLPHFKLVQEGLSVVKLHGSAYGLLVGDKLNSPLDEETRARFRSYLPEHLILLAMGLGAWDQRVLDMVELAHEREGEVWWLHFEEKLPPPLAERFGDRESRNWFHPARVRDPGAFLREVYGAYKLSHPSSSRPFPVCDMRPVPLEREPEEAGDPPPVPPGSGLKVDARGVYVGFGGRLVVYEDAPGDYGLGASLRLACFVASRAETHLPVWVDLETKFTVEDVLVDLIQQLRRFDPGLPPEILIMERAAVQSRQSSDFRKVVRRLYAALSRGRYIIAFNGVLSFGRRPTSHHSFETVEELRREPARFRRFLQALVDSIEPGTLATRGGPSTRTEQPASLGLLDSILVFALDRPRKGAHSSVRERLFGRLAKGARASEAVQKGPGEPLIPARELVCLQPDAWQVVPFLVLLTAIRRRRSLVALHRLLPKYLGLGRVPGKATQASTADERWTSLQPEIGQSVDWVEAVRSTLRKLEQAKVLWRLEGGDYWMSRKLRNEVYDNVRSVAERETADIGTICAAAILAFVHRDLAEYHHRDIYVGAQDVASLLEEIYHRIAALRHLRALEKLAVKARDSTKRQVDGWLANLASQVSRVGEHQQPSELAGVLDRDRIGERRSEWLGALFEVLQQEREALLSRVPGVTLQGWGQAIGDDLEQIAPPEKRTGSRWGQDIAETSRRLGELVEDIQVAVLQDRMKTTEIVDLRRRALERQLAAVKLRSAAGHPREWPLEWLLDGGKTSSEPSLEQLEALCRAAGRRQRSPADPLHLERRVFKALVDAAWAIRRGTWDPTRAERAAEQFEDALRHLLAQWSKGVSWTGGAAASREVPVALELQRLELLRLRLAADQKLWVQTPWDSKGKGESARRRQTRLADSALDLSERALQILDSIREEDRTLRSYLYSLKGRALYLRSDFDAAYREFDLARAGLSDSTPKEREALAVTLLRQAECLMVHSDEALADWVIELIKGTVFKSESKRVVWPALLSSEGRRKLKPAGEPRDSMAAVELLLLSLANCSPEVLDEVESQARAIDKHRRGLADTLGAMGSRLAAAGDLLGRVEGLLEPSRSNVEWWACLFQLHTQLAVERLLLLISGDLSPLASTMEGSLLRSSAHPRFEPEDPWESLRIKLSAPFPLSEREAPSARRDLGRRSIYDPLAADRHLRRRFINRFQEILRRGVMAVRQGLDVLLPNDAGRQLPRLENDVLLRRLLRTWTELMVCGAYATEMSQGTRPEDDQEGDIRERRLKAEKPERWEQWRYLNWLSGLVTLPKCGELELWFYERDWNIGPPGLASRACTLARIDQSLASPLPHKGKTAGTVYAGGMAVRRLLSVLHKESQWRQAAGSGGPRGAARRGSGALH